MLFMRPSSVPWRWQLRHCTAMPEHGYSSYLILSPPAIVTAVISSVSSFRTLAAPTLHLYNLQYYNTIQYYNAAEHTQQISNANARLRTILNRKLKQK